MPYRINKKTGTMEYLNASTGAALVPAAPEPQAPNKGSGFLQTLIPRTYALAQKAKAGITLNALTDEEERNRKRRQQLIEQYIKQAKTEPDQQRRSRLLGYARELSKQGSDNIKNAITQFEQESGTKINDKERIMAEALGVAGELGSFIVPAGKLGALSKTGRLIKAEKILEGVSTTKRILRGAQLGAKVGALQGVTDPEAQTLGERVERGIEGTLRGGVAGAATSAVFELPRKAVQAALKTTGGRDRLARLFKVPPSAKAQFRKSTGGMDFEEEILVREGKALAGKDYNGLVQHFTGKLGGAMRSLEDLLSTSNKTGSRAAMIGQLQKLAEKMKPSKGRVGTAGAHQKVQSIIDDISQYPTDSMPITALNQIKRDLQTLGDEAYSVSGKPSPGSKAMANAASFFQKEIEKLEPGTKDLNRSIQLYQLAKRSIESTGDAAIKNQAGDVIQKILQVIPAVTAAGAGIGIGAAYGGGAGVGAAVATLLLTGGSGFLRNRYIAPEFQTRMIASVNPLLKVLKTNGVKNADNLFSEVWLNVASRLAAVKFAPSAQQTQEQPGVGQVPQPSLEGGQSVLPDVGAVAEPVDEFLQPQPDENELVTIVNNKTGEERQVRRNELQNYGVTTDAEETDLEGLPTKEQLYAAMILDAQTTGGKNIAKLKTLIDTYDKISGEETLSAAQKKRIVQLQQAETTVNLVEDVALKAGTGVGAFAKGKLARLPGVEGGAEEDLERLTDGLAKAIAATLASESGVATDKDIQRWKGLMPQLRDTMEERQRAIERLRGALQQEQERLNIPGAAGLTPSTATTTEETSLELY